MKLNLRSIDLNLLIVFDALMIEGKLCLAAERLNMTQPAASNALQRLRVTVNDVLFIRTRNGMIPTLKAKELHKPIQQALRLIEDGFSAGDTFDPNSSERSFTIAATDYGETVLLNRLMTTTQNNRDISYIMSRNPENNHANLLAQGELDLIIDYQVIQDNNLCHECVTHEEVVIVVDKSHPRIKTQCSIAQYFAEYHVVLPQRQAEIRPLETLVSDNIINDTLKQRNIAAQVTHFSAMPPLICGTDLVGAMPKRQAEVFKEAFNLHLTPLPFTLPPVPLYQTWHTSRSNDPALTWLRTTLTNLLAI